MTLVADHPHEVALRPFVEGQADTLLRSILSATSIGVLLTDLDHMSLACNRAFGQIWGVDPRSIVSNDVGTVRNLVQHRVVDLAAWQKNLQEIYDDPSAEQHDHLVLQHPHIVLERTSQPVRDSDGNIMGRLWTFTDVTEEARLRRMRESMQEASFFYDPDPRVVYEAITEEVGRFYESLCFLSIRHGETMEFRVIGGPADHPVRQLSGTDLINSYCQFCLANNSPTLIQDAREHPMAQHILPAKNGLTRYAGVPVFTPSGELIGTFCILDGRSEQILDEEDLRYLGQMALRIGSELEREAHIARLRKDLDTASHELEEAQRAALQNEKLAVTGTLSASIAHDIRNILSAVSLEIELGRNHPTETLQAISDHLDRFNILSHRLLSYVRPERVETTSVDVGEVVQRVASLLGGYANIAGLDLRTSVDSGLPPVSADPGRLDHLLINLTMNAIQVSPPGGKIDLKGELDDGHIIVRIIDEGPGIPAAVRERLFEPFVSGRSGGTGLGMFSCQQIVREIGGTIEIGDRETTGTVVTIRIPKS